MIGVARILCRAAATAGCAEIRRLTETGSVFWPSDRPALNARGRPAPSRRRPRRIVGQGLLAQHDVERLMRFALDHPAIVGAVAAIRAASTPRPSGQLGA